MSDPILTKEQRLKSFLDEIEAVSKKHGLSIAYTSCDGFMVNNFNPADIIMLKECVVDIKERHE